MKRNKYNRLVLDFTATISYHSVMYDKSEEINRTTNNNVIKFKGLLMIFVVLYGVYMYDILSYMMVMMMIEGNGTEVHKTGV